MNELNFSNSQYKDLAMHLQQTNENVHPSEDAFFLLINGLKPEDLSNLCLAIQNYYKSLPSPIELSIEECYKLTQNLNIDQIEKKTIQNLAYQCVKSGLHLGNNTINDGKINTSSWISHAIYSSEVCANLAKGLGINEDRAKTFGLLHDYGRKFNHSFAHVLEGFEALVDLNWYNEAIGCLTHSFVNGGRCSNNEPALNGFYLDDNGDPNWQEDTKKDDITLFLENYKYTEYDIILNISDLMATDKGIVAPHERIADIATRRIIDPTNRSYFLADITNILIDFLKKNNFINDNIQHIKATKNTSPEEIESYFNKISQYFFQAYIQLSNQTKKNFML